MGARGMVATGHPLSSDAALDVLKAGGNAFDAALCASAVLAVVKSYHCGLGGDLFGIFHRAKDDKTLVLNGSGRAPRNIRPELFGEGIPHRGMLAASTPGTVDGWVELAAELGSRRLAELLEPAIYYADNGFPVFPHLGNVIRASEKTLGADAAWSQIFLPRGKVPDTGAVFVQKDLAATLRAIAAGGREAFYAGSIASLMVRASEQHHGCFSLEDFAAHRSRWDAPLFTNYRGYDVSVPPPNSFGLLLLLQLKYLSEYDLAEYEHNRPAYVSLLVKAKAEAWRTGQLWIADPDRFEHDKFREFLARFPEAPTDDALIEANAGSDTTYVAAADKFGNWASLIQSVHQSFGCGVVVDGTGIVLNNRMSGFNLIPGHPNELAPGRLPAHTLSPAMIFKEGKPIGAIGTPGGFGQTQFLAQTLCNVFNFDMNVQEAVEAPRWQSEKPGEVELESRFSDLVSQRLTLDGYDVKIRGDWEFAFGGVEAIFLHATQPVFMGAADPRREGYAIGY
jgi:gamma-glutamyltranspeptidase/glutathione hydrolase